MENKQKITVFAEPTPNPHSMKFTVSQNIAEEIWETKDITKAGRSPLAQKILGFPWAETVFIGSNFITITKEDWVEWDTLTDPLSQMIQEHIESGQAVLLSLPPEQPEHKDTKEKEHFNENPDSPDSATIQKIKQILQTEIQPAVAMDGGFIAFAGYKKGTVFLKMQGACSGCPSSSVTLKQGIETHLKNQISEVRQVVAL